MNFAESLKQAAKESGQYTIKPKVEAENVKKSQTMNEFAANLKEARVKEKQTGSLEPVDTQGLIQSWSFSSLKRFETCPYLLKLEKVDKESQKSSGAKERGNILHTMCQDYVEGTIDEVTDDKKSRLNEFLPELDQLRELYHIGKVSCEEEWGIRKDWSPCGWNEKDVWGRAKTDVCYQEDEQSIHIIDYKSGQWFGNEAAHGDQGLNYGLHAYHRFPEVNFFKISFWYLDFGKKMERAFNRRQLTALLPRYHNRANRLTSAQQLLPTPNASACLYCPYGSNTNKDGRPYGTGTCPADHYRGKL